MAEDGPAVQSAPVAEHADNHDGLLNSQDAPIQNVSRKSTLTKSAFDYNITGYGGSDTPMTHGTNHRASKIMPDLDEYFVGPRDLEKHSKLPYWMQMHGSVLPRMIVPIALVAGWATLITCLHMFVVGLDISNVLLTVLGFVVGLALSFRSSSAYERYSDGCKAWSKLSVESRALARTIWVHIGERDTDPQLAKDDLLAKVTAMNLILAFAVSLKHKLRFEPYAHYPDIQSLVGHLDTFAKAARGEEHQGKKKTPWKVVGEYLGLRMANSNPRKELKRASSPLGDLPLEILTYLSSYIEECSMNGTIKTPPVQGALFAFSIWSARADIRKTVANLQALNEVQSSAERVLSTPLPVGYNILISQIVMLYVYVLPFQLVGSLGWVAIPGTMAAAYIIIGLAAIGNELENPFGNDVNDLPLDQYCAELAKELDVMTSVKTPRFSNFLKSPEAKNNEVLWPLSTGGYGEWRERSEADIRSALRAKVAVGKSVSVPVGQPASLRSRTPSVKLEMSA
ncbi:UPF0187 protein [Lachnellula willkommii]|uniref:UPF0187 protein n=1 Tax=Lachnellula willkommii TaxID=215461 RepID=A0A559M6R2_9HELO|nr:UPF0187 protein [Lachnellula willkommii]